MTYRRSVERMADPFASFKPKPLIGQFQRNRFRNWSGGTVPKLTGAHLLFKRARVLAMEKPFSARLQTN